MSIKSTTLAALAMINVLAVPAFTTAATAQTAIAVCVRECNGSQRCIETCGSEVNQSATVVKPRLQPIRRHSPARLEAAAAPSEDWIEKAFVSSGGDGGGGGGGGGGGK